jgi:hypothetical protein
MSIKVVRNMRFGFRFLSVLVAVPAFVLGGLNGSGASATTISWQTNTANGGCASGYTCNSSEMNFMGSDGSTLVTAKAWSYLPGNDTIYSASLGMWSPGMGVISPGSDGSHTIDNGGYTDFVSFYFSETVDLQSVFLNSYGDTDFSAWIGTVPGVPDFAGDSLSDLDFNYGQRFDNYGGDVNRLAEFGADSETGNLLVIAALAPANGITDLFKIKALYAHAVITEEPPEDPPSVSTPSTMLVFGPTVFGLAWYRRRRARQQADEDVAGTEGGGSKS